MKTSEALDLARLEGYDRVIGADVLFARSEEEELRRVPRVTFCRYPSVARRVVDALRGAGHEASEFHWKDMR